MKYQDLLENWGLEKINLNLGIIKLDFNAEPETKDAAWELYVQLITRIANQSLLPNTGDNKRALESLYELFEITRKILITKGRKSVYFSRIAIIILNEEIRPFTAKWHQHSIKGELDTSENNSKFRGELLSLQIKLRRFSSLLLELSGADKELLEAEKELLEIDIKFIN